MKRIRILRELKGVFEPPRKSYYFGEIIYGMPYFHPRNHNPYGITVCRSENKMKYNRNFNFDKFGWNITLGFPIIMKTLQLGWKDKYNTPRMEWVPGFYLYFFKWQFCIFWNSPKCNTERTSDLYWEMVLWWLEYSDKDILRAEKTWSWIDSKTNKSTWEEKYIKK